MKIEDNNLLKLCYIIKRITLRLSKLQDIIKILPLLNKLKPYITNIMYDNNYRILLNMLLLSYINKLLNKKTLINISHRIYIKDIDHKSEIILLHEDIIKFHNFIKNKIYNNYIINDEIINKDINIFEDLKLFILKNNLPLSFEDINKDLKNIILKFHFEYFNNTLNDLIFFIINNLKNLNDNDIIILKFFIITIIDIITKLTRLKYEYFYNYNDKLSSIIFNKHIDIINYNDKLSSIILNKHVDIINYKTLYEINKNLSFNDNLFKKIE